MVTFLQYVPYSQSLSLPSALQLCNTSLFLQGNLFTIHSTFTMVNYSIHDSTSTIATLIIHDSTSKLSPYSTSLSISSTLRAGMLNPFLPYVSISTNFSCLLHSVLGCSIHSTLLSILQSLLNRTTSHFYNTYLFFLLNQFLQASTIYTWSTYL